MKTPKGHNQKRIEKLWDKPELINELFSDEEWQRHKNDHGPSAADAEKMYANVIQKISEDQETEASRPDHRSGWYTFGKYAVAATVLLISGLALWKNWKTAEESTKHSELAAAKKKTIPEVQWVEIRNTGKEIKHLSLSDASVVKLYPKAELRYIAGFSKENRNVYLVGKAYFNVSQDAVRPFSVYAGGLKTTALGTSFTINTLAGHKQTSVKLHSGKVVVASEMHASAQEPIYLNTVNAGLLFDQEHQIAKLQKAPVKLKPVVETLLTRNGSILSMKNIPLTEVIQLLSEAYQVKILAENKEINNISFTGVIDVEKENIDNVLKTICLINNLSLNRGEANEYLLSKH